MEIILRSRPADYELNNSKLEHQRLTLDPFESYLQITYPTQLRQALLHHALHSGFHFAARLAAPHRQVFVPNTRLYFPKKKESHLTTSTNLSAGGMKCKGSMNEAVLFVFSGASALTFHPPYAFGIYAVKMGWGAERLLIGFKAPVKPTLACSQLG